MFLKWYTSEHSNRGFLEQTKNPSKMELSFYFTSNKSANSTFVSFLNGVIFLFLITPCRSIWRIDFLICTTYAIFPWTVLISVSMNRNLVHSKWFSRELKWPRLRYEIGISLDKGHIVSVHGPYPCGQFTYLSIFRLCIKGHLIEGEKVVADKVYPDEKCATPYTVGEYQSYFHSLARARHECGIGDSNNALLRTQI